MFPQHYGLIQLQCSGHVPGPLELFSFPHLITAAKHRQPATVPMDATKILTSSAPLILTQI